MLCISLIRFVQGFFFFFSHPYSSPLGLDKNIWSFDNTNGLVHDLTHWTRKEDRIELVCLRQVSGLVLNFESKVMFDFTLKCCASTRFLIEITRIANFGK